MAGMLKCNEFPSWINKSKPCARRAAAIIDAFLFDCPCGRVSRRARPLLFLSDQDESSASRLVKKLSEGVDLKLFSSPEKLNSALVDTNRHTDDIFYETIEYAYVVCNDKVFTGLGLNLKTKSNPNGQTASQLIEAYPNLLTIEALLRHIRNAIAHGSFQDLTDDGKTYWFFQDCSANFNVTSRCLLEEGTLMKWRNQLHLLES